jgi:hypothetical protein
MPWISREEQKQRELQAQRKRQAEDAVSGRLFYTSAPTPTTVKPLRYELFNAEISSDAWQLWHHLRRGQKDTRYGLPTEQTDAQLAETYGVPATTPERIAAVLEELVTKELIRIEERQGKRFIDTSTARTCGLVSRWISL